MAMTDIVNQTKTLLHGAGLGEKPVITRAATDAAETITGSTIVFSLLAGEGASSGIAAGDVLSVVGAATQALSAVLYVLSVSTDAVTALNSYDGAPATAANALDAAVFELNAPRSEFLLWADVSSVIAGMLWPEVYLYTTETISSPDQSNFQNDLAAATERIVFVQQVIGGETIHIAHEIHTNVSTTVASTGVYAELYVVDGSAAYVSSVGRVTESSTLNFAYNQTIATGAAALAAGSMLGGGSLEASSKDSQQRVQLTPRQALWQDFVALRSSIAQDLSMEEAYFSVVL